MALNKLSFLTQDSRSHRMLCIASALLFFSQLAVSTTSYYFGIEIGKSTILLSYGIYLTSFLFLVYERGWDIFPARNSITLLFAAFVAIVTASSAVTLVYDSSPALLRNFSYLMAFGIAPFLLGSAQNKKSLECLLSIVFYGGICVALITIAPSSWSFDLSYGRPIFLGADFLRLLLGLALGTTTIIGFYYAVSAPTRAQSAWTLACTALSLLALYFNVMRMAYYLTVLLLMLMPLQLLIQGKITGERTVAFVAIAFCLHLISTKLLLVLGLVAAYIVPLFGTDINIGAFLTPDSYYGLLARSQLNELDWAKILQQFSSNNLPLISGHSAIGLNEMFDTYPNDSTIIRVRLYLEALMMLFSAPVWGVGASMFSAYSYQGAFSFPHSTLLHVAAELGSTGLLVFCLMLAASTWRLLPHTILLLPFLFFLAIDQTHGGYFTAWGSYFFSGVAASLQYHSKHHSEDSRAQEFQLLNPFWALLKK